MNFSPREIGLTVEGDCCRFEIAHLWDISGHSLFIHKLETLGVEDYYGALFTTLRSGQINKKDNDFHRACTREMKKIGPIIRKRASKLYDSGEIQSRCATYNDAVHAVLMNFMLLYEKMQSGETIEPITVDIKEYGRAHIWEGHHRVAIAHAAGLREITGKVRNVDPQWARFMRSLKEESENGYKSARALYNPIPHPLFRDWQILREDRLPAVRKSIDAFFGTRRVGVLDLGAHLGYFSLMLALEGHNVTAVEINSRYFEQMSYLKEVFNARGMHTIKQDAVEFVEGARRLGTRYDLILLLSVAYHLARKDRELTRNFLRTCLQLSDHLLVDDEPNTGALTRETLQELVGDMCWIDTVFKGIDHRTIYALRSTKKRRLANDIEIDRGSAAKNVYSKEYFDPWKDERPGKQRND